MDDQQAIRVATCVLKGKSPYSQSKVMSSEKLRGETSEDHEKRCWKERCHVDNDGIVYIPPMCAKNALAEAAKFRSRQIPGRGKETYTKYFEAAVMVSEPASLGVHIDDVQCERVFVPSDGKRGGTKRVWKYFPFFQKWEAEFNFYILDRAIGQEIFETTLQEAGNFIGFGRFRPRNNGYYGRFTVEEVKWSEI